MKKVILMTLLLSSMAFANRESGGREGASAVFVSFLSFGTGVDPAAVQVTDEAIFAARRNGSVLEETYKENGREGEAIYCVKLKDAFARHAFIKAVAPTIVRDRTPMRSERTLVYVGTNCNDMQNASLQNIDAYLN